MSISLKILNHCFSLNVDLRASNGFIYHPDSEWSTQKHSGILCDHQKHDYLIPVMTNCQLLVKSPYKVTHFIWQSP